MSYVFAVRKFGVAAILTDCFLGSGPYRDRRHDFTSHKNGVLFQGCIYGVSGTWREANQFLGALQEAAAGAHSPQECWRSVERTVEKYRFPVREREFQILFSSRHEGEPIFFGLRSSEGRLIRLPGDVYSLGSGREILDPSAFDFARQFLTERRLVEMQEGSQNFTVGEFPFLAAFLLHQFAHGPTSYDLLQRDIGGFFHFVRQDANSEARQRPSLYVLGGRFNGSDRIIVLRHRLAFVPHPEFGDLLVFSEKNLHKPPVEGLLLPNVLSIPDVSREELDEILASTKVEPPYHALVAGPWDGSIDPYVVFTDIFDGYYDADMSDFLSARLVGILEAHATGRFAEYQRAESALAHGGNPDLPEGWITATSNRKKWEPPS